MSKKMKIKGHVAHKMIVKGRTYFYIVAPERESVEVYAEWSQPPIGYAQVDSIHITPRMLGRHGYLQSVIKRLAEYLSGDYTVVYCQNDVSVTEKAFKLISNEEKKMDTSNIKHFVLVAKIKSDDDRVTHDWEYIQVVQQGDRFMLLFDNADITQTEVADLTKYLSGVLSIKDVSLSVNPEFMNYAISFSDNFDFDDDPIQNLCSILADGAKYKHTYPLRARHKATSSVSSIAFSIQENGDTPIFTKRWDEGLNGYISINARVYNEHGVDVRPYKPLDSDVLKFHVRRGRVRLIKYPTRVIDVADFNDTTCSQYARILTTKYHYADDLIKDCRAVLEHFGMYSNASDVKLCWHSDFLDGYSTRE